MGMSKELKLQRSQQGVGEAIAASSGAQHGAAGHLAREQGQDVLRRRQARRLVVVVVFVEYAKDSEAEMTSSSCPTPSRRSEGGFERERKGQGDGPRSSSR
jgi:hypothetical protein